METACSPTFFVEKQNAMLTRLHFLILLCPLGMVGVFSQNDTLRLTLSQAQQLALEHHAVYQNYLLDEKIAGKKLAETQALLYPQASASFDLRYNIERPITLLPGESVGKPGEVIVRQLGPDLTAIPSLDLSQTLYDGRLFTELKILKTSQPVASLQAETAAGKVRLLVTASYLNTLIAREKIAQLRISRRRRQNLLEQTRIKVEQGFLNPIEQVRVQTLLDNTASEISQAEQAAFYRENLLKSLLDLPAETPVALTEDFTVIGEVATDFAAQAQMGDVDFPQLPAYRLQKLQADILNLKIEQERKSVLPAVSLYAHLGVVALGKEFSDTNAGRLSLYFNSYVGVRTQWRLNSLIEKDRRLPQLQWRLRQTALLLQEEHRNYTLATAQAKTALTQAYEDYRIRQRNEGFAKKELDYLHTRFANDLASAKDLLTAELDYSASQQATTAAFYQYLLARFEWLKARGEWK
jgi:outer membrane protein TolC